MSDSNDKRDLGERIAKASPALRALARHAGSVASRAARDLGALVVQAKGAVSKHSDDDDAGLDFSAESDAGDEAARAEATAGSPLVNVYLRLDTTKAGDEVQTGSLQLEDGERIALVSRGGVAQAQIRQDQIDAVMGDDRVIATEIADSLRRPIVLRDEAPTAGGRPEEEGRAIGHGELHGGGAHLDAHATPRGLLVGIIDVEGYDFSHEDFLVGGKTRFVRIWDQGGASGRAAPEPEGRFHYGSELRSRHMDRAIEAGPALGIAAYHLEGQSTIQPGSHGTHVASIAAGNHGVCPHADIAAVLIHLPKEDWARERTFVDSTRIDDAVDYLLALKESEGYAAVTINISLGMNGHAHDGSSGACRWIDDALDGSGRAVCIAAGNAGQEAAQRVDDLGFVVGRIHTSGRVPARGLQQDVTLEVASFPIEDVSPNKIELWYEPQDRLGVSVRPPGGAWIGPIEPGAQLEAPALDADGNPAGTAVGVYNDLYVPENGANRVTVFLQPIAEAGAPGRVAAGTWTIRLEGLEIRDGRFHGWIERDDPVPVQGLTPQSRWHYPAYFTTESNVDNSSISSLACTRSAIAVGNLHADAERMAVTSSQGPTRDGRAKPEVCAPGTGVLAACGFHPGKPWIRMSGTSMASPYVAGVAGLMLNMNPKLTPAQVRGIMLRTTRPLPGGDYAWRDDAGYGRIDAEACIVETSRLTP